MRKGWDTMQVKLYSRHIKDHKEVSTSRIKKGAMEASNICMVPVCGKSCIAKSHQLINTIKEG